MLQRFLGFRSPYKRVSSSSRQIGVKRAARVRFIDHGRGSDAVDRFFGASISWDDRKDQSGSEQGSGSIWQKSARSSKRAELRYYASTAASGEKFKKCGHL
jgi:hypothetical protein